MLNKLDVIIENLILKLRNFFLNYNNLELNSKLLISQIKKDIIKLSKKGSYKDKYGKIRRVEKIYDKTKNLKKLNKILKDIIYKILKKKLEIFKDKCHFKPPGGAGFKAYFWKV